ncbi:CU044_5270 family protein [Streptomyces sp. NPDC051940]|uniref:CU044_5270 family protein n=1 Tax=Streptomyces sp. NPDC051940 TaxID=3155675 RepID=UPI0034282AD2
MNELELLKEWDADAAPLGDQARRDARSRLLAAVGGARPPVRRRAVLRVSVAAAASAAVATTYVVRDEDDHAEQDRAVPRMQPAAAVVLNRAAERERATYKPVVPPRDDQFIYTKVIHRETNQRTGAVKTYVNENWESIDGSKPSWGGEMGHGEWSKPSGKGFWPPFDWETLTALPTDPDKLIVAVAGPQPKKDLDRYWADVHFYLGSLLYKTVVMPKGLRAAAYEALGKIPGITVTPGQKSAKGREGVAISFPGAMWAVVIIFDPRTYECLGYRSERVSGKNTYTQLIHQDRWAVVDRAKQRP